MGSFEVRVVTDKFNLDRIYAMFSKDFQKIIIIIIIIIIKQL